VDLLERLAEFDWNYGGIPWGIQNERSSDEVADQSAHHCVL
jgi:hypothetical protein